MSNNPGEFLAHNLSVRDAFDRALAKAGASWVLVASGSAKVAFLDDRHYEFIANPHFKYWLPLTDMPDSFVLYQRGKTPILLYNQPADFWHKTPEDPTGVWLEHFDTRVIRSLDDVAEHLPADREKGIAIAEDSQAQQFGIERLNPLAALNVLHNARTVKTDYELSCMRAAQKLAVRGHLAAAEQFRAGGSEYAIHMAYCEAMRQRESELPYNNIVALNEHAAVLHYQYLDRVAPTPMRSFLIDAGAQVHSYAADITRTYSFRSDDGFAELISAMETAQQAICGEVREGADYKELHLGTHDKIAQVMVHTGIATGSKESLIDNDITKAFFPHGLGHFLGLQVHDVAGLADGDDAKVVDRPEGHSSLRLTRSLKANQVLTIEPGLYFIPMLLAPIRADEKLKSLLNWTKVDALTPYGGIRIEDNVQILAGGCRNLTREAFAAH